MDKLTMIFPTTVSVLSNTPIEDIVANIQMAVAPAFLLTGIAGLLGVLVNRIARIIDRARLLESRYPNEQDPDERRYITENLALLSQRARLISLAISAATACALMIALVIMIIFVQSIIKIPLYEAVPSLFVIGMSAFIVSMLLFLREIYVATATLRIGPHKP
jgi:hypothetical protein